MPEARNSGPSALNDALQHAAELEVLRHALPPDDRDDVLNLTGDGPGDR